jgi:signal transduction histidine kinase/ActR/RegA family two-component response regulator
MPKGPEIDALPLAFPSELDAVESRQSHSMINGVLGVAIGLAFFLSVFWFFQGNSELATASGTFTLIVGAIFVVHLMTGRFFLVVTLMVLYGWGHLFILYTQPGTQNGAYWWTYAYTACVFFLCGPRLGFLLGASLALAFAIYGRWQGLEPFDPHQPSESMIRFLASHACMLLILWFYEKNRSKAQADLKTLAQEANQAARARETFLAAMSHEVRTPLNAVMGAAELLRDIPSNPKQREWAGIILESTEALVKTLNNVLDFSRVRSGRVAFEKVNIRMGMVLHDAQRAFLPLAEKKGLWLKVDDRTGDACYIGDPLRIRQILMNLIDNAIKYTRKGGVHLLAEERGGFLWINVVDTGDGIPDARRPYIFLPFSQAEPGTFRRVGGTGLGLSLSRDLARAMGGDLTLVETEADKGSCFRLALPVVYGDPGSMEMTAPFEEAGDGPLISLPEENATPTTALRVLLVEDNPVNQKVFTGLFENLGLTCDVAENGVEAIELYRPSAYDLVLMDLHMPIMDGMECTRKLREKDLTLTIIGLTADSYETHRREFRDCGLSGFLPKPLPIEVFIKFVEERFPGSPLKRPHPPL